MQALEHLHLFGRVMVGVLALPASANAQGITERVSVDSGDIQRADYCLTSSVSGDGQVVVWTILDDNYHDIFLVHDRTTEITQYIGYGEYDVGAEISADGRFVVFSTSEALVADDTNGADDIYVFDRTTGLYDRCSVDSSGAEADLGAGGTYEGEPSISADGRFVVFTSYSTNLVANDDNGTYDVFVHDRSTGATDRVSVDPTGADANDKSGLNNGAAISADGRFVAFESFATNLVAGATGGWGEVYVRDRQTGVTERVSIDSSGSSASVGGEFPSISADGRFVVFTSWSDLLVPNDTNGVEDVFVRDRTTGSNERVNVDSSGAESNPSWSFYSNAGPRQISADGRLVLFTSDATNLVPGVDNGAVHAYVHDRATGETRCVDVDSAGNPSAGSDLAAISADGSSVVFRSQDSNLVPDDTNNRYDIFLHECCWTAASWSNYGAGFPGTNGVPSFTASANPVLGTALTLALGNSSARYTVAALFIGLQRATISSNWGGDLLVDPLTMTIIGLGPSGTTLSGDIPNDQASCGVAVDLQALEADPGAAHGVSFTAGLELVLGH